MAKSRSTPLNRLIDAITTLLRAEFDLPPLGISL